MASRKAWAEKQLFCRVAVFEGGGFPLVSSLFLQLLGPQSSPQPKPVALQTLVWCSQGELSLRVLTWPSVTRWLLRCTQRKPAATFHW